MIWRRDLNRKRRDLAERSGLQDKWSLMGEGDSSLMGAIYGHIGCRGDVVKRVTTNAIKQEIYDLWLGGATTYCGATASKFDRN